MKILFLCVANSARSQMAEGLAKKLLGSNFIIESAGSEPSGKVHGDAITVMKEEGVDISRQTSKFFKDLPSDFLTQLQYVITLCAEEFCPAMASNAKRLHWAMPDPAAAEENTRLETFRTIKDQLKEKIISFKDAIDVNVDYRVEPNE